MRILRLPSVACPVLRIFLLHLMKGKILKKMIGRKMCVLIFSTTLSETFLILRRNEWDMINPLTPELNPSSQRCLPRFVLEILIFKGLSARRLYKSFGIKGLSVYWSSCKVSVILIRFYWNLNFTKILKHQISLKSFRWEPIYFIQTELTVGKTDRRTDRHDKLIIAFRDFVKAPEKWHTL
jgi:hypothetical protein